MPKLVVYVPQKLWDELLDAGLAPPDMRKIVRNALDGKLDRHTVPPTVSNPGRAAAKDYVERKRAVEDGVLQDMLARRFDEDGS